MKMPFRLTHALSAGGALLCLLIAGGCSDSSSPLVITPAANTPGTAPLQVQALQADSIALEKPGASQLPSHLKPPAP